MVITPANDVLGGYYDLADFHERHWSGHYHPWALDIYERLLFTHLRQGARRTGRLQRPDCGRFAAWGDCLCGNGTPELKMPTAPVSRLAAGIQA
jgi:hypothetical protein